MRISSSRLQQRIGLGIILLIGVYVFPWWLTIALALLGFMIFHYYVELVLVGILLDTLYVAAPTVETLFSHALYTLGALVIFFAGLFLKDHLRSRSIEYVGQ